jgi:DMSO/TMAO reductase YedYZ molybdopterin-dependent catalytic subunit
MLRAGLCFIFLVALFVLTGCGSTQPTAVPIGVSTAPPTVVAPESAETAQGGVLELSGPSGAKTLTMEDLQALPATEGWAGGKSSTGRITPPELHTGVTLQDLAAQVGGPGAGQGLRIIAKDGYAMTFSYDQIANGDFITYDPGTGDEITIDAPLQTILAYARNGEPISEDSDGPLRIAVLSPENNQVVDGHWMVKWVTNLEVMEMAEDWTLHLDGALAEEMDRATFESCAATNCHQASWTDADGQVWSGVPLWLLAGRIDGGDKHGDEAYDETLAQQGYTLEVVAGDGYSAAFDSQRFDHNDAILLANLLDGELLPEKHFPLRLVGAGLEKSEMVGQVAQIVADLPEQQATAPAPAVEAPPEAWTLQLEGALTEEIDWAAFVACANCHQATWTDADGQVWTGVPLWQLVGRVDDDNRHDANAYNEDLATQGYAIQVTAADGYSVPLDSARINRDSALLVAHQVNGAWPEEKYFPLRLVGPDLQKNEMVGQIASISLDVPAPAAGAPLEAPSGDAVLTIVGGVAQEQALSIQALQGMEVVEVDVEHPKKGLQTYRGVRLNALLGAAGIDADVTRVVMRAGDGFETHASLEDVRACGDCLVAFTDGEQLDTVMPGMEGGLWVKDVIEIELQ